MERPKCPLCKTRHFAREGCDYGNAKVLPSKPVIAAPERSGTALSKKEAGFDRNAYQREYMRFWRAKRSSRAMTWKPGLGT